LEHVHPSHDASEQQNCSGRTVAIAPRDVRFSGLCDAPLMRQTVCPNVGAAVGFISKV
ncbi:hypothetical protein RRG08_057582, partial [Elysia crispata]